jgi:membrane protease YdiL (CAAX protease family)
VSSDPPLYPSHNEASEEPITGGETIFTTAPPGRIHVIFFGSEGLRPVWRMLIAAAIFVIIAGAIGLGLFLIPGMRSALRAMRGGMMTPAAIVLGEGTYAFAIFLTALIMTRIEHRTLTDYGLPLNVAFGKRFWQGMIFGFVMISVLLGVVGALHGFSILDVALNGALALRYGLFYLLGFFLVAFFEEFLFRGYSQATTGSGSKRDFWTAAIILSIIFGGIHLGNPGEAKFGALMAGTFGLLAAFTLWRTGNIWFAIGMHCAWDWGETFFYGVPDSGILARGHFLDVAFHGPAWLTGGTVGPEGSVLVFVILGLTAVAVHFMFPARQMPTH